MRLFKPIKRPDPVVPDSTLDEDLQNSADDANLTLYMINMVVVKATGLPNLDAALVDKSDPYCVVTVGDISDRTLTIENNLNPVWNDKMSFFVPKKPEKMLLQVFDEDKNSSDDLCGSAEFEFGSFFEIGGGHEGDLPLTRSKNGQEKKKGRVTISVKCRTLKPVETEIKLGHAYKELACLGKEKNATIAALDESEELRKEVVGELSNKEQEILAKAAELEEAVTSHNKQLSVKEKAVLDLAEAIEAKVQEKEEAEVARREAEAQKEVAETKLTDAEKKILAHADLLEEKEKNNKAALTEKEKEVLAIAQQLEVKEQANKHAEERLGQVEALKVEVENELTSKDKIIQEQAKQIELKAKESEEALSKKDKEILEQAKELDAKEAATNEAQKKQDNATKELDKIRKQYEAYTRDAQKELDETNAELSELRKEVQSRIDAPLLGEQAKENENEKVCPCTIM